MSRTRTESELSGLKRIVPRDRKSEDVEDSTPQPPVPTTPTDSPANPGKKLSADQSVATRSRRRSPSKASEAADGPPSVVRVKCRNCGTRFYFKTAVEMRYECRECGGTVLVSPKKQRFRNLMMAILGITAVTAGVVAAIL